MNQNLIDALWTHTNKINDENHSDAPYTKEIGTLNIKAPILLDSANFFTNASTSLFMSFHNVDANDFKHFHDFFELLYICKGNPIGVINDQELQFEAGNLCIMNPNAIHYFKKCSDATDLILNIVLPKELFQKSIFRILFNDPILNAFFIRYRIENEKLPSFMFLQHQDLDIEQFIELLLKEYLNKKEYSAVVIESLLTLIFSSLIRNYKKNSSQGKSAMSEILDYIYLNYQTTSMESLAKYFNYHPKYLSYLIRKETGQTYRELIVSIKLQISINYLMYKEYTIEQITEMLGYKDKSSYYSQFKKAYNMSPADYRKQHAWE